MRNQDVLSQHHAELDRRIALLLEKADGGDPHELGQEWNRFERELLWHFEIEERELFPAFSRDHADEAAALRDEHDTLQRDLLALGIRADLHFLRAEAVRAFIDDLRLHAAREDAVLYRWAREHVGEEAWTRIAAALNEMGLRRDHVSDGAAARAL
jgi:hemerythrin-like domain-containing protein